MTRGNKVLAMIVGINGATASTMVAGVTAMRTGFVGAAAGTTDHPAFSAAELTRVSEIVFAGWDLRGGSVYDAATRHAVLPVSLLETIKTELDGVRVYPGIYTPYDIPVEPSHSSVATFPSPAAAIRAVADQIDRERTASGATTAIVVYLGSPTKRLGAELQIRSPHVAGSGATRDLSSGLIYAYGALEAGAHFIDFTPCDTLESSPLLERAAELGHQLAGRDGSTGQTMLKMHFAHLLAMRGIRLTAWYSTNVIGNHDGYVLSLPGHSDVKLADKTDGVANLLGYDDFEHKVTIDYFPPHGDSKESWDAIDAEGWCGGRVSVRVNWRAQDSLLASPLLLDLIRLVELGERQGRAGLVAELGFFFKRPLGREGVPVSTLFDELVREFGTPPREDV